MKKLLLAGFLSFAALGLTTTQASAWPLLDRLFDWHCCGKCTSVICCRQYNAFTPVCFGSITCIGCCPINNGCGMPTCAPQSSYPPVPYAGPAYDSGACCNGMLPEAGSISTSPAPSTFVPPMPNPVTTSQMYPQMGRGMVQPVAYRNGYYAAPYQTGYYPAPYYGYRPMMPQMNPMQAPQPLYGQPTGGSFNNAFFGGN